MSSKILIFNYIFSFLLFFFGGIVLMLLIYNDVIKWGIEQTIFQHERYSDPTKLCILYKCDYISKNSVIYFNSSSKEISRDLYPNLVPVAKLPKPVFSINNIEFYAPFSFKVDFLAYGKNEFIIADLLGLSKMFSNALFFWIFGIFLIDVLSVYFVHHYFKEKEKQYAIRSENDVYYNSLMLMSENINHEINTPLTVLNNKIESLKNVFNTVACPFSEVCSSGKDDFRLSPVIKRLNLEYVFNTMVESIAQIGAVTARIKELKQIKYSENHKPIYEIFKTAMDILQVSQNDKFSYEIPEELKEFKLSKGVLTDSDLLGIILNHITNSIEANSTFIKIHIKKYTQEHFRFGTLLKVLILDNGNGIPTDIVKKIYNTNFSSKGNDRGNGLSINRFIISRGGGEINLIETSEKGTIFELVFLADRFKPPTRDLNEESPLMLIPNITDYIKA